MTDTVATKGVHAARVRLVVDVGAEVMARKAWEDAAAGTRPIVVSGRIVQTPGDREPYKAVLTHEDGTRSERSFPTMMAGEAFIRSRTPRPLPRESFRGLSPGPSPFSRRGS